VHRFPSEEWTQALRIALNNSRAYREAGKPWTFGSVAMIVRGGPADGVRQDAGMVLYVHQGECRGARYVEGVRDPEDAAFVIVASYACWKDVIEGKLDPIKGMMEGKLKLARGHLPTIIRFVESSRQLVVSARKVPTDFSN
jgi:putative sterol carrier protein